MHFCCTKHVVHVGTDCFALGILVFKHIERKPEVFILVFLIEKKTFNTIYFLKQIYMMSIIYVSGILVIFFKAFRILQ